MQTYAEVQAEIQRLTIQAKQLRKDETEAAIKPILALMAKYEITLKDLQGPSKRASGAQKGEIRYRDVATGDQWIGRGPTPKWLEGHMDQGRSKEDFRVKPAV